MKAMFKRPEYKQYIKIMREKYNDTANSSNTKPDTEFLQLSDDDIHVKYNDMKKFSEE